MGLFSLLCCGSDANDSAEDKYKQMPSTASSKEHRGRDSAPGRSNNIPESEHSLSEIDKPVANIRSKTPVNTRKSALITEPLRETDRPSESELPQAVLSDKNDNDNLHTGKGFSASNPESAEDVPTKELAKTEESETSASKIVENATHSDKADAGTRVELKEVSKVDDETVPKNESAQVGKKTAEYDAEYDDDDAETEDLDTKFSDNSEDEDEVSPPLDLTKIQDGQTFHPETGLLLGPKDTARFGNKKCLILDLDETLVHSSFKYLRTADFVIPVEIDNQVHHVYVIKRPGVDEFLRKVGKWYEVVVFTASVAKYGDPLLNKLDIHDAVHHRLFRDSCYSYQGNFIKNLSQIGRPLADSIIIDNSPASYIFHPQHSVPISSWFSDTHDNELLDLLPLLEDLSKPKVDDVSLVLDITI